MYKKKISGAPTKWGEYEKRKKKLLEENLDPDEYTRRLRELCKELKI